VSFALLISFSPGFNRVIEDNPISKTVSTVYQRQKLETVENLSAVYESPHHRAKASV
jgi:hypothetical protein